MHFAHVVLIDHKDLGEQYAEEDIKAKVEQMMTPFDENIEVEPYHDYLSAKDVASMARHYGTHDLVGLATRMEDWTDCPGGVDKKGLYKISTYNPQAKWDWWRVGGRWDGMVSNQPKASEGGFNWSNAHEQLPGNVVLLKTIDHELTCHSIITPDGAWHECVAVYQTDWQEPFQAAYNELTEEHRAVNQAAWRGENDRLEAEWFAEKRDILAKYGHCLAVGVDYHM